jgi:hypothetical protein
MRQMSRHTTFFVLAATLAVARTAAADVAIAGDVAPAPAPSMRPAHNRHFDGRAGFMIGGADTGDATGLSMGFHGQLGYRFDAVSLFSEFDYYTVGDSPGEDNRRIGRSARVGATVRYSLLDAGPNAGAVGGDWWVEAGAGYEHVNWNAGGVLDRPDLVLGMGLEVDGRPGYGTSHMQHAGWYFGFRTVVGQAPKSDAPTVCGGPCTMASQPSRTDVSMYFITGLHWGR